MPLTLEMLQLHTEWRRREAERLIHGVDGYGLDQERKQRKGARLCLYCFYLMGPRIAGQAFTAWTCRACDTEQPMHHNTAVPYACNPCADQFGVCVQCGSDLDLRTRHGLHPEDEPRKRQRAPQFRQPHWGRFFESRRTLRAGKLVAEVYHSGVNSFVWHTFDSRGKSGLSGVERTPENAEHAAVAALVQQARSGGTWKLAARTLRALLGKEPTHHV